MPRPPPSRKHARCTCERRSAEAHGLFTDTPYPRRPMDWRDGLQLAGIVVLIGIGATLLVVGALGSGGLLVAAGAFWFWRLYRTAE